MKRTFLLLSLLALGSCAPSGSDSGGCSNGASTHSLLGNPAPGFEAQDLQGASVTLETFTGKKPTLLAFWATWCPTCKEEIPVLNEWSRKYPNLQIVGVNVQESVERVKAFTRKQSFLYPVVLDLEGEVAERYGLVGIPAAVLINRDGRIIYFGFSLPQNIEQLIA